MAITTDGLTGIGVPPEVAKRLGSRVITLTAAGTIQAGAPIVLSGENAIVNLTTAGGNTATTLPGATAEVGCEVLVNVVTATAALVFPPLGHSIANKGANGSVTVAIGALFVKTGTTTWSVTGGAT